MAIALFQVGPPSGSIDPFIAWLVGVVWLALTGTIGKLYLDSRAESKRKDQMIDRLLTGLERGTKATDRAVTLAERHEKVERGQ